jgi:hypothetical protein
MGSSDERRSDNAEVCTVTVCDQPAAVQVRSQAGYTLRYCLDHLWLIDQGDRDVALVGQSGRPS